MPGRSVVFLIGERATYSAGMTISRLTWWTPFRVLQALTAAGVLVGCAGDETLAGPRYADGAEACNQRIASAEGQFLVAPSTLRMQDPAEVVVLPLNPFGDTLPRAPTIGRSFAFHTYLEAENRFGAPLRLPFRCVASFRADAGWLVAEHAADQSLSALGRVGFTDTTVAHVGSLTD